MSLKIELAGGATLAIANIGAGSPGCTTDAGDLTTCTVSANPPVGDDVFTLTAYDQANGGGVALSRANVTAKIVEGQANTVSVALNGVIASVALRIVAAKPAPAGTAGDYQLIVDARDRDGYTIVGPGNYDQVVTLSDDDTSGATSLVPRSTSATAAKVSSPSDVVSLHYTGMPLTSAGIHASVLGVPQSAVLDTTFEPVPTVTAEYDVGAGDNPEAVTSGPDGNIWFTKIGVITGTAVVYAGYLKADGTNRSYLIGSGFDAAGITTGPDRNLWLTHYTYEGGTNKGFVDRISPNGTVVTCLLTGAKFPAGITTGPDRELWFTADVPPSIGVFDPADCNAVAYFKTDGKGSPKGIVAAR